MAWFDGAIDTDNTELEANFPNKISENLRINADGTKIAIINTFKKGDKLYEFADPHLEKGVYGNKKFYHIFIGNDAITARRAIENFVKNGFGKGEYEVSLFRKDKHRLFMYCYGELHTELKLPQSKEKSICADLGDEYYVLPLKCYAFKCPVCGERNLQYRGYYEICIFCGWEDTGTDDEDGEPFINPNGDYTIRQYREEYKSQLKRIYDMDFEKLSKKQKRLPDWEWKPCDKNSR